jgi:glucose-1-phosphate thymidylyltransferase
MVTKGIILAGGSGTRLHPITRALSKQLVPVYDKPMIYYPLSVLMLAGIREVLVITTPEDQGPFRKLLGDGTQWGLDLRYAVQPSPDGLAQAFLIGREFIAGSPCALVLGDNIFYGHGLPRLFQKVVQRQSGATVFGYFVQNPEAYGVAELDDNGRVTSLEEKPQAPRSNYAVNRLYLERGELFLEKMGRGVAWLDTGTHDSLLQAAQFIQTIQARQGLMVSCPEEIAFASGWIDVARLRALAAPLCKTAYGQDLLALAQRGQA